MGDNRLAVRGGTTDSRLLPGYLAALGHDEALTGVRFEKLEILSVASIVANAISAIFEDSSVSDIFGGENLL